MTLKRRLFSSSNQLAGALAARVADALRHRLDQDGATSLAVPGGRTPGAFLTALSGQNLDWSRISVTLTDERQVPETSERSNARLLRQTLLHGPAGAARFVSLAQAPAALAADLAAMPRPFAAVVLGMGEDGHTASLFPGADRLAEALDPAGTLGALPIQAPGADEPRLTLTLPALVDADFLAILIEGQAKQAALARVLEDGPAAAMPIRAVLRARPDAEIWAAG